MNLLQTTIAGLGVLIATVTTAGAGDPPDNYVYFALPGVSAFSFIVTGSSITPGKKMGRLSAGTDANGGYINVPAQRKGSTDVANWFKRAVGSGQTLACDSKSTFPEKLNFAVQGTLVTTTGTGSNAVTVTCDNVIVAQGHDASNNNWWMGGPDMKGVHVSFSGITFQKCAVKGKTLPAEVVFTPATPCVNHFNLSVNPL
jgi:hypothetical protein